MELKKLKLPFAIKSPVLALGSHSKNTVCFAKGNFAYLSQVHPDLSRPQDCLKFKNSVKYFLKKRPKVIACDLHPEYQSTKYAQQLSASPVFIQHHHAHIASCMAENGLKNQKVIGVALDGTGLGSDGTLWGAEFFICDYKSFRRKAHLKEIPLLGGERAVLEPWRLAAFWLYLAYQDRFLNLKTDFVKNMDKRKWRIIKNIYLAGFNSPLSSSMGRLFDSVASLVLAKYRANFEAQLAIELEKAAGGYKLEARSYKFKIVKEKDKYIIDPAIMFREIIADLQFREPKEKIAHRFHLTVARMIKKVCLILREEAGINKVVLSGGVFQNNILLRTVLGLLYKAGFRVFIHRDLSCSDYGVSLGEAVITGYGG